MTTRLRITTGLALASMLLVGRVLAAAADRLELVWPTPDTAWVDGKSLTNTLQHAGSGDPLSGGFGGVRGGGSQFHEGIDIKPVARDGRGEPKDSVFAAMSGVVRYVNPSPGDSSYGRYIVLEHPDATPAVYTLYAHLARVAPGVITGARVQAGQTIGTMGHSSGGYMIPTQRAHLHFELGVAITREFQTWYDRKRFGSRNEHGMWNGMNLVGVDPIAFYNEARAGRIRSVQDFLQKMEPVVRLRIATIRTPDFVTRYPSLMTKPLPVGLVAGWEIRFNWTGLPFEWTPLSSADVAGLAQNHPRIVEVDANLERRERSKSLAVARGGTWIVGKDLAIILEQLFGPTVKL